MRGRALGIGLAVLGCAIMLMHDLASASITRSRLRDGLASQMRRAGGASGAWAIDIAAPGDRVLFSWASRTHRILASNTKLFTSAAVLDRFGPERRLETRLYTRSPDAVSGRTLRGNLVIVGTGDPVLGRAGFARRHGLPLTPLGDLARDVREAGIRRVTGDIRADDTIFDRRRGVPTSGVDASGELCSLSGLSYDSGFVHGHCAKSPELVAARALKRKLRKVGVRVKGETGRADLRRRVLRRRPLAQVDSPRIKALLAATNRPSNNFFSEMLLKRLAARPTRGGTTRRGARKAERFARSLGTGVRMENGSGLSRSNRASPRQVGRLLARMSGRSGGRAYRHSLPVGGRQGTLAERMNGTAAEGRCRAKTGTLIEVSALSGYCRAGHGLVAFSILMNSVDVYAARSAQDKMASLIARYRR